MKKILATAALFLLLLAAAAAVPFFSDLFSRDKPLDETVERIIAAQNAEQELRRYLVGKEGCVSSSGGYTGFFAGSRVNLDGSLTLAVREAGEELKEELRKVCEGTEVRFEEATETPPLSVFSLRDGVAEYLKTLAKARKLDSFGLAPVGAGFLEVTIPPEDLMTVGPMVARYVEENWPGEEWRISYRAGRLVPY